MRFIATALSALLLVSSAGCGAMYSGAKAGVTELKGAEAKVIPIRDISPATIKLYTALTVGEVTTDVGEPICPPSCVAAVQRAMREQFGDKDMKKHFPGGGKTLVADVVCRYFQAKKFLGGDPRLDLLVTLKDGEAGQELGRYYVAGVSEAALAGKLKNLAEENAKELCELLEDRKKGRTGD